MVIWSWKERRHFVTKAHVKAIKMWNSIKTFKCAWYDSQQLVAAGLRSGLSAHKYDGKSNPASRGHLPQYPIVDDANAGKTCRRTRFHTTHNNLFFSDVPVLYSMGFRVAYSIELDVFHVFRTQYCSIIALRKQFGFNQSINQSINQMVLDNLQISENAHQLACATTPRSVVCKYALARMMACAFVVTSVCAFMRLFCVFECQKTCGLLLRNGKPRHW